MVEKIIFAVDNGISRAPMAELLLKQHIRENGGRETEVLSRGVVVQFSEPLNQKAEAVMISNGISVDGFSSKEIENDDVTKETLIFTMEQKERQQIIRQVEKATEENTFVLTDYIGEELEIMNPIGGTLASYGLCFEALKEATRKLAVKLELIPENKEVSL